MNLARADLLLLCPGHKFVIHGKRTIFIDHNNCLCLHSLTTSANQNCYNQSHTMIIIILIIIIVQLYECLVATTAAAAGISYATHRRCRRCRAARIVQSRAKTIIIIDSNYTKRKKVGTLKIYLFWPALT